MYLGNNSIETCGEATVSSSIGLGLGFNGDVTLSVDAPAGISANLETTIISNGGASEVVFTGLNNVDSGMYNVSISASDGVTNITENIELSVNKPLTAVNLIAPIDGDVNTLIGPLLAWDQFGNEDQFKVQISPVSNFSTILLDTSLMVNTLAVEEDILDELTLYYWRVVAENQCGNSVSQTFSFTTEMSLSTFELDDLSLNIYPNPTSETIKLKSSKPATRDINISLYGISGARIYSSRLTTGMSNLEIDVSNLISGLYLVKIEDETFSHTEKIIISH